jgi:phage shock protein A
MSESVAVRVRRIISAGINDLVDAFESSNADGVMREAIREIDRALGDVRSELGRVMVAHRQAARHIELTRSKLAELAPKLAVALAQSRDDLAEAVIARQIDLERQLPVLEASLRDIAAKQVEMEGYIAALNGKKSEMERDLAVYLEARRAAGVDAPAGTPAGVMQAAERRVCNADKAFSRVMASGIPGGQAEAQSRAETATQMQELERLERSGMIAARLAEAKARVAG